MSRMVRLIPPKGTDEANADGFAYHVHDDGTMSVPEDEIGPLLRVGGLTLAPEVFQGAATVLPPLGLLIDRRSTTIDDVIALARRLPVGDLKARLLGAIAEVAKSAPRQTVKVRPPSGTTGFSHGGEHFEIGEDGLIDAPIETLDSICDGPAGFSIAADDPPVAATSADDSESVLTADKVTQVASPVGGAQPIDAREAQPDTPSIPRLVIPVIPSRGLPAAG
jgi:hypothetical protein